MLIHTLVLGAYENNSYVLRREEETDRCVLIDTGLESKPLLSLLEKLGVEPEILIFTHAHGDHIAGARPLRKRYPEMKIAVHRADSAALACPSTNLAAMVGEDITSPPADILLDDNMKVEFAGIELVVIHTPGHSPGGICLYNAEEKVLFCGDTLFAGSVGRTDFPSSAPEDHETLINGIRARLMTLPGETKVYPGHGPATTIRNETRNNPFLQQ